MFKTREPDQNLPDQHDSGKDQRRAENVSPVTAERVSMFSVYVGLDHTYPGTVTNMAATA